MTITRRGSVVRPVPKTAIGAPWAAWLCLASLVLCLAALGGGVAGVLKVRSVEVVGARLPVASIIRTSGVSGQNIFTVRSDTVIDRLASLPRVQVDRVETQFPDKVTIFARLRPAAVAWQSGAQTWLLDANGLRLQTVRLTAFPIISGGNRPPGPAVIEAVRYAARVLPGEPDGNIAGYTIDPRLGLVVSGKSGWKATIGHTGIQSMVGRVAKLAALLRRLAKIQQQISSADFRFSPAIVRFTP